MEIKPNRLTRTSQVILRENMSLTLGDKGIVNRGRDARHQRVQQFGRPRVVSKVCTLPGPHRDEFHAAGLFCWAGDIPHDEALERVWQNLYSGRVHRIKQLVLDAACEPSREATSQRRLTSIAAEQSLAILRTRP